ncbi:virion structural protein [Mycobacterium phage Tonenili]|uniref:Capsid decoration protein n=1 Tax=Mycobacterium phage Tonenili TaxID=1891703 RepID=A0A1C9EHQ3_9CAUD|nr:virion structural protein [Mycobacterium phage Tonenili]AON96986.1 hypothetical protein SEA_TONENILI_268 [Mycobacterium phage Tonenili]
MQKRALRINFNRSVSGGKPDVMEVAVAPLSEPNSPNNDATLVGGTQTREILLTNENNQVVFELVPTDHPDLTERVLYRIAWRKGYMGRQTTADFVMPDFDVDYDNLKDLGNIIGGETYLQWTDRGRAGGVAALNSSGQVTDADGNVVGSDTDGATKGELDAEIVNRQQADQNLRNFMLAFVQDQVTQIYSTTANRLIQEVAQLQNADTIEKAQRTAAVAATNHALTLLQEATNQQIAYLNELIDNYNEQFADKADLVNGKIPSSQLPDIAIGRAVPVADEGGMLSLTASQVQPGDFAVRPDGVWFLNAMPPSDITNWVQFTIAASVFSVNGQDGVVVLSAADVGARDASTPIPMGDVSGLNAALSGKADSATVTNLSGRVTDIETDTTYVKKVGGLIVRADMPEDAVFVNASNLITKKDGTVLNTGGGGTLDIDDVEGLQEALDDKLDSNDPSVTNARTPVAHAASHATGGSDELTPASIGAAPAVHFHVEGDIDGLTAVLANRTARIASLEGRVEDLELGGGGTPGGGGASGKTVWWNFTEPVNPLDTATDEILLRSPFGFNGANYYYDPAGALPGEAVWPYITPNGHLKFVSRNESAPPDPTYATAQSVIDLTGLVNGKADQAELTSLSLAVDGKASTAALSALEATVATKADTSALNATNTALSGKADQSALDTLTGLVNGKADQSDLSSLAATVAGKADQSSLTSLTSRVSNVETGKADLISGAVPVAQVPQLPISRITDLTSSLAAKADLSSGKLVSSQLPDVPTNKVVGLDAALSQKADLIDGKVATSQLPSLALNTVVPVANRAAMLALTSAQVQPGDIATITATDDKGTYMLVANDPSVFGNWVKLSVPDDAVQTVNGQKGTVVLSAADVGARSSAASIPMADITGLVTALNGKVDTSTYSAGLAGKTSPADVQTLLSESTVFKQRADLVATTAVASTSGQQSIDGVLTPVGSVVLLTAQSSSVANGLWQVASGAWTRVGDMAAGSYFLRGTVVVVTSGANHGNSIWQQTNSSGIVGTNANNWTKILTAGAVPNFTASLGVDRVGNDFRAKVVSGGGVQVVTGGLQLDPNVAARKFSTDVPAGSTVVTINHGLNTLDVSATFRDKASGDAVLVGWRPTGVNTISVEFDSPPAAGQWRCVVIG